MGRKAIDMTGKRFGRWTVLYRVENKGANACWHCRCDCGNEKDVQGTYLRNGVSKSCGCLQREVVAQKNRDNGHQFFIGERFGHLTVLEVQDYKALCKCDCGTIKWIRKPDLVTGDTTTCGCRSWYKSPQIIDETGNRYGKLTVIEEAGSKNGRTMWRCRCDCGKEKITLGKSLRAGLVKSCGCLQSQGELRLKYIFDSLNLNYETQKTFEDLRSDKDYPLFFDFYLKDYNILIEYQGEQHYHPHNIGWNTLDTFTRLQYRDNLKREYCQLHNIPLIEIPYTDFNNLNEKYVLNILEVNNENHSR